MSNTIGVITHEDTLFHIQGNPVTDHDTLCGIDAYDEEIGHLGIIEAPKGQKVDCWQCRAYFSFIEDNKITWKDFE